MRVRPRPAALSAIAICVAAFSFGAPAVGAQQTHVLIVSGLAGEPRFARTFIETGTAIHDAARTQWRVADSSLIWLAEEPGIDPARMRGRSTREAVESAFLQLSRRVAPGDQVLVVLIGHGGGEREGSRVNLPGPDPTAADFASWIAGFSRQSVIFVNASSASGDFVDVLRGAGRVVITATRSAYERNESLFASFFGRGLATQEADANKDGRITVREAFEYADAAVVRSYETAGTMRTEHAVLSDTILAARLAFGPPPAGSDDPRVRALIAERQALEAQLTTLRGRKEQMPPADYERELERILVLIAEKSAEIRAAGGRP